MSEPNRTIWRHLGPAAHTPTAAPPSPSGLHSCSSAPLLLPSSPSPTVALIGGRCCAGPDQRKCPPLPPPCSSSSSSSSGWRALRPQRVCTIPRACVRVCVWCRRSMGTGFCGCQLQSALTCASNVVYCPNASPEENVSRPLKFKAIYHPQPQPHLRPLPSPPALPVSHHPSLPPPPHPVSASPPPPLSPSITSIPSPSHGLELKFRRD